MKLLLSLAITSLWITCCQAQVVQLPAVGSFGVNTTVSVPDQGTASLGGVGRSSYGTTSRGAGPMANTARGGNSSATMASVSATIIDLAAMDEALLNMPAGNKNVPNYATRSQGTKIVNTLTPHNYHRDIKRREAPPLPYEWMAALGPQGNDHFDSAENKVRDGSNVRYFMEKSAAAHAHGHDAAARVYYKMALDRMTPAQQQRMEEIRAKRAAGDASPSKNGKEVTKSSAAASTPASAPAEGSEPTASPFDPPAGQADPNTDMNSSPF